MSESVWRIMLFKLFTQRKEMERKLGELHEAETLGWSEVTAHERERKPYTGEEMSEGASHTGKINTSDFSRKQRVHLCLRPRTQEEVKMRVLPVANEAHYRGQNHSSNRVSADKKEMLDRITSHDCEPVKGFMGNFKVCVRKHRFRWFLC